LTARASTEDQRRAKEIGIDDYLTKPVDSRDLVLAIENALLRSRLAAEETRRKTEDLRNRIVGILQHEFRTPLTFVLGYAELLATTDAASFDFEDLRQWSTAILDGGRRLQRLIEGFLLLAELQNQTLAPTDLETLHAWTIWEEMANDFRAEAAEVGITIALSPQHQDVSLSADFHLLSEALRRLVDNAIRYRRRESRLIQLSVERLSAYVGLRITDDGMGIPANQLAKFGQPFEQPGRAERNTPGTGLSLALVKDIARLHGGNLEIESTYGVGSTFTLWLPSAPTEMDPGAA
jgi:signal transduction histidine kinase